MSNIKKQNTQLLLMAIDSNSTAITIEPAFETIRIINDDKLMDIPYNVDKAISNFELIKKQSEFKLNELSLKKIIEIFNLTIDLNNKQIVYSAVFSYSSDSTCFDYDLYLNNNVYVSGILYINDIDVSDANAVFDNIIYQLKRLINENDVCMDYIFKRERIVYDLTF